MKEIKFRAFVRSSSGFQVNKMRYESPYTIFEWEIEGVAMEIMQFTGLKDDNGRDIYFGDIVNCGNWRNDIVEFKNGSVWLKYRNITLHRHVNDLHMTVEVIGNIFENRELLSIRKKFYSITGEKYYLKLDFKEDLIKEIERIDPESVRRELLSIHKENCRSVAYFNASTKELEFYSSPSKDQILRQEHLILLDLLYEDRNPYLKHYPVFDLERIKEDVELLYQL